MHQITREPSSSQHSDPVCKMTVSADTAAGSFEYRGTEYFFCSKGCVSKFASDPEKFLTPGPARADQDDEQSYTPLAVIVGLIAVATLVLTARDAAAGGVAWQSVLRYFMTGFFLVFAGFKLVDLRGFADGYATYDLLASRLPAYGYAYPFLELGFGLAMLAGRESRGLYIAEFAVMAFSGLGVAIKLIKREKFQCACLGTFLKVPLTKVTLIEDFGMAAMALAMIFVG